MTDSPWVLVTGFGPFLNHSVNPSWQAVKGIPNTVEFFDSVGVKQEIRVVKKELSVEYRAADDLYGVHFPHHMCQGVQRDPLLIIHVGVNSHSACVELEKCAVNEATGVDVCGHHPDNCKVVSSRGRSAKTGTDLDLDSVVEQVKINCLGRLTPSLGVSGNAGRYLCNYVYYKACEWVGTRHSTRVRSEIKAAYGTEACPGDPSCLFIHVPVEGRPHSVGELSTILLEAIITMCKIKLQGNQGTSEMADSRPNVT
jgi:pyroglutamyl-peptidase